MTGSIAINLHAGSSSEYLAQYIFSCFGTAIATPHQEDSGIDLHCTLIERIGSRGWPREHFSVQVKSTMDPWAFDGKESVRWLVEYPLPLFFCVVDKKSARIRIYQTSPRFHAWAMPPLPDRLVLRPTDEREGKRSEWTNGSEFSLGAPILDIGVVEALDDQKHQNAAEVLKLWLEIEKANLNRIRLGIHRFMMPFKYQTDSTQFRGESGQSRVSLQDLQKGIECIKEQLCYLAYNLDRFGRIPEAACCALLFRRFEGEIIDHIAMAPILGRINQLMRMQGDQADHFAGVDALNEMIDKELEAAPKAD